jgi:hypothetical protein
MIVEHNNGENIEVIHLDPQEARSRRRSERQHEQASRRRGDKQSAQARPQPTEQPPPTHGESPVSEDRPDSERLAAAEGNESPLDSARGPAKGKQAERTTPVEYAPPTRPRSDGSESGQGLPVSSSPDPETGQPPDQHPSEVVEPELQREPEPEHPASRQPGPGSRTPGAFSRLRRIPFVRSSWRSLTGPRDESSAPSDPTD